MTEDQEDPQQAVISAISARLREALSRAGGAAKVAKRIGMPPMTISNYVAGRDMKASALAALADACEVSIEWLATGRGTMTGASGTGFPGFDDSMSEPANFYQLCMLIWHCQDYFRGIGHTPSLADVLEWVSQLYPKSSKFSDYKFKVVVDQPLS